MSNDFRWVVISLFAGILAGTSASVFLILLDWATNIRDLNPQIIWLLPAGGFLIGWLYHVYGADSGRGTNLVIDEIHNPKNVLPLRMAPLVLFGTLVTHLFGGSAGREGTAVQIGATLSDQLTRIFTLNSADRKTLLAIGMGAGFGAAIGAPWAGVIFGMEVIQVGRPKLFALVPCLIGSFAGFYTTVLLHAPHSQFPQFMADPFQLENMLYVLLAGVLFGFAARVFSMSAHFIEHQSAKLFRYPPLKPLAFGIIIVVLYRLEGSYRYVGLGIPAIKEALVSATGFWEPLCKLVFTALTVGSGFKGGEFVPLVFIGTTLGSALSNLLPVSVGVLAPVGFASVFAGATNTPIACSIMAVELFGWRIAPYAVAGCFMSYFFSGSSGVYKSQR